MILIYSFGVAFILSVLASLFLLFFAVKESLNVKFVPKLERKEKKVDVAQVEKLISSFFEVRKTIHKKSVQPPEERVLPPPTNLKLKGIIISEKLKGAIFGDGKERFVLEGQNIGGYTLKKVLPTGVFLSSGSREYFLAFKPQKATGGITTKRFSIFRKVIQSFSPKEVVVSRREVEAITKDPAKMFTQIRLVPYIKNGKTQGFIFEWVKPGSIFYRLGIRKGDVLVSINNMTITSGEDAFRILQMLRNEPNLKVVLIRGGRKEEINVRIE